MSNPHDPKSEFMQTAGANAGELFLQRCGEYERRLLAKYGSGPEFVDEVAHFMPDGPPNEPEHASTDDQAEWSALAHDFWASFWQTLEGYA